MTLFKNLIGTSTMLVLFIYTNTTFGQNIEYSKQIDNNIKVLDHYLTTEGEFKIVYYKAGENILRREENKIQLINQNFEKLWEYEVEIIEGVGATNFYHIAYDDQYIYVLNYNVVLKAENSKSVLTRLDYSGGAKKIDFTSVYNIRSAYAMEIIDGNLYVLGATATGTINPYMNTVETSAHIIILDSELKQKGTTYNLPNKIEGTENNILWNYTGIVDGNFTFWAQYDLAEGSKSTVKLPKEIDTFLEDLVISPTNEIVSRQKKGMSARIKRIPTPYKYDADEFQIKTDSGFSNIRGAVLYMTTHTLEIIRNGNKSANIIESIYNLSLTNKKLTTVGKIMYVIEDIVFDPINDNLVLIIRTHLEGQQCLIELDNSFNAIRIQQYQTQHFDIYPSSQPNFSTSIQNSVMLWEQPENKHKKNGFDYAIEKGGKSQYSFLNYPDYQIVIEDSRFNAQTWGYKIIR